MVLRHSRGISKALYTEFNLPKNSLNGNWFIQFLGKDKIKFDILLDELQKLFTGSLWKNINTTVENYNMEIKNFIENSDNEVIIYNKLGYEIDDWINHLKYIKNRGLIGINIGNLELHNRLKVFTNIRLLTFNNNEDVMNIAKYIHKMFEGKKILVVNINGI